MTARLLARPAAGIWLSAVATSLVFGWIPRLVTLLLAIFAFMEES